jgi:type IV secretory pathway TraG/TraD family ATPase VirD4
MTPWVVLGLCGLLIAAAWLAWCAGRIAGAVSGHGFSNGPGFGSQFIAQLLSGHWAQVWPGVTPGLAAGIFAVLTAAVVTATTSAWLRWRGRLRQPDDPLPSLASIRDLDALTLPAVAARAVRLRRSLAETPPKAVRPVDAGVALGTHRGPGRRPGPILYASWEDVLVAVMAPRTNKTTALAVPAVLDAPGAVVATSNKPDLWATTSASRGRVGKVWVFDPQSITHSSQLWWWNPLATVTTVEDAHRLATHFVHSIDSGGRSADFWSQGALDLITSLVLAASAAGGSLWDVQRWLANSTSREPVAILQANGFIPSAKALQGAQAGAPETREGIYQTARTAAACLANPEIMAWVTPRKSGLPAFALERFVASSDTLYLQSKDGAGAAAPLVAGLTDQVMRAGVRRAELLGGRLDPPLIAVLDEACNICRISDLPDLYSHFGSRGIVPITIMQSLQQGQRVWGEHGMGALWGAATVKLVGPGMDDARFAEDLSRLVGEHDIDVASSSRDGYGQGSWQTSVRRQRILDPADLRALPKGTALLLTTGSKAALIDLLPWYDGKASGRLTADIESATAQMTRDASAGTTPIGAALAIGPAARDS